MNIKYILPYASTSQRKFAANVQLKRGYMTCGRFSLQYITYCAFVEHEMLAIAGTVSIVQSLSLKHINPSDISVVFETYTEDPTVPE